MSAVELKDFPLRLPQPRRIHRQIEQGDMIRQRVIKDGSHDVRCQMRIANVTADSKRT